MRIGTVSLLTVFGLALSLVANDPALARGRGGSHGRTAAHGGSHLFRSPGIARPRLHIGVFAGAPLFAYRFMPYPGYAALNSAPLAIEYIEREPIERSASDYWYFCPGSRAYYPYVKECPGGWQAVEPVPPQS